jgi:hypothetical protein
MMVDQMPGPQVHRVTGFARDVSTRIAHDWAAEGKPDDRFPAIAAEALLRGLEAHPVGWDDLTDWAVVTEHLPHQPRMDETFGQPPLTLFWNGEFQVDALFWLDSSTAVHGHGFSGAFLVLAGRSLHTRFAFEERHRCTARFRLGEVRPVDVEVLDPGDVRRILPDAGLIHSVVHLGVPSVTLVARTCGKTAAEPELVYFPPSLAVDPSRSSPLRARRTQIMRMLVRCDADGLMRTAEALVRGSEAHTAFLTALQFAQSPGGRTRLEAVLSLCEERWPGTGEPFARAIATELRHSRAVRLLSSETDAECRLFLGALAALDERQWIEAALRRCAPSDDPDRLMKRCVQRLYGQGGRLTAPSPDGNPYDDPFLRPLAAVDRLVPQ